MENDASREDDSMRPHEIVASVEPERWGAILTTVREHSHELWHDLERTARQDQRIPPQLWQRMSPDDRQARIRVALRAPASAALALDAVREYLLAEQPPPLVRFLDAAGIEHSEGVLDDGPIEGPSAEQLDAAIETLRAEFPEPDALLYLRTLAAQDNTAWSGLVERLTEWDAHPPPTPQGPAPRPRPARGGRATPESGTGAAAEAPAEAAPSPAEEP